MSYGYDSLVKFIDEVKKPYNNTDERTSNGNSLLNDCYPNACWRRTWKDTCRPPKEFFPSLLDTFRNARLGYNLWRDNSYRRSIGETPIINPFNKTYVHSNHGVPCGGMGSGFIGRGYRGGFNRYHLSRPGIIYDPKPDAKLQSSANQFILRVSKIHNGENLIKIAVLNADFIEPSTKKKKAKCSSCPKINSTRISEQTRESCWPSQLSEVDDVIYLARFPQSWTIFINVFGWNIDLILIQTSPFIPKDYGTSCLPFVHFEWIILNHSDTQVDVSLALSWGSRLAIEEWETANEGWNVHQYPPSITRSFQNGQAVGILMNDTIPPYIQRNSNAKRNPLALMLLSESSTGDPTTISIAIKNDETIKVSLLLHFDPFYAPQFWKQFYSCGHVQSVESSTYDSSIYVPRSCNPSSSVLCGQSVIVSNSVSSVEFIVSWDIPIARFPLGHSLLRRYVSIMVTSDYFKPMIDLASTNLNEPEMLEKILPDDSNTARADGERKSASLCAILSDYGFNQIRCIQQKIIQWQSPFLLNHKVPGWLSALIFNELYFLVAGGSLWTTEHDMNTFDDIYLKQNSEEPSYTEDISWDVVEQREKKTLKEVQKRLQSFSKLSNNTPPTSLFKQLGHFLFLEGLEYLMINTYDVLFYASWSILDLFPELELSIQADFATAVMDEDDRQRTVICCRVKGLRKARGRVPHDLGGPGDIPIITYNTYNLHHTDDWKDLPCKFILQIWRDYNHTRNLDFLRHCFKPSTITLSHTLRYIDAKTYLINHGGWPDHTYDTWNCSGVSAYSGGLFVAALDAYRHMLEVLSESCQSLCEQIEERIEELQANQVPNHKKNEITGDKRKKLLKNMPNTFSHYTKEEIDNQVIALKFSLRTITSRLSKEHSTSTECSDEIRVDDCSSSIKGLSELYKRAEESWITLLWDDQFEYFRYDSDENKSVHVDQLAGCWFSQSSGLDFGSKFKDKCSKALKTIMKFNVEGFHDGQWSAINGVNPKNGKPDTSCLQSKEVWIGVCYGLAATLWLFGLKEDAIKVAQGINTSCWNELYLWFQTPEAIDANGRYRAYTYMRPLSAWALAYEIKKSENME